MTTRHKLDVALRLLACLISTGCGVQVTAAQMLAFPDAEGFGRYATGGRGGDVYHVTNLNDTGPGSLRFGIQSAFGPRTIVFDVSGTIDLGSRLTINKSNITLAGQTAPGAGITLKGYDTMVSNAHDVIIRYMRFRPGDINGIPGGGGFEGDSLSIYRSQDVIVDHVSASWSIDETLSVTGYQTDDVTVQWSFITESLNDSFHTKGAHGKGALIGDAMFNGDVTYHHNLMSQHDDRNPLIKSVVGQTLNRVDFSNNAVYNWGTAPGSGRDAQVNYVGNYIIAGDDTKLSRKDQALIGLGTTLHIYQADNLVDGNLDGELNGVDLGWAIIADVYTTENEPPFETPGIVRDDPLTALQRILNGAGAALVRDAVDQRVVQDVLNQTGSIIDSQNEVGGWPELPVLTRSPEYDTDEDGMADDWERTHGLSPDDASDRNLDRNGDGFTNLEEFLNSLLISFIDGDLDGDGFVGITDLNLVLGNWNLSAPPGNIYADPSEDGFVGIEDLNLVLGNWNSGTPPVAQLIPEPGSLVTMTATTCLTLWRMRWTSQA